VRLVCGILIFKEVGEAVIGRNVPSFIERERERTKLGGGKERHYRFGGGYNRNIILRFGRFPGSAR
jgi:hypothetical protein